MTDGASFTNWIIFIIPNCLKMKKFVKEYKKQWEEIKPTLAEDVKNGLEALKTTYGDALQKSMDLHKTAYPTECSNSLESQIDEIMVKSRVELSVLTTL